MLTKRAQFSLKWITAFKPSPQSPCLSFSVLTAHLWHISWKTADIRFKYLQQIRNLYNLFEAGVLTDREFVEQKATVLDQLEKLTPDSYT